MSVSYQDIIIAALEELRAAVGRLVKKTSPATPEPRPRIFHFGHYTWPSIYSDGPHWGVIYSPSKKESLYINDWNRPFAVSQIIAGCDHQPRLILRALRRIQAATAWCEARTEGRKRQAEEILRQQQAAVEALEAEAAMLALKY